MIRDAVKDDAPAIARLIQPHVEKKILLGRSLAEITENADRTVVFSEGPAILGSASLVFFSATLCEIRALVIADSAQGRGLGRDLVLAAEAKALRLQNERPMRFFALTYTPEFFERVGYERTTKDQFPEKIYEVCNFCLRKDDCHEIAVQKKIS